MAGLAVDDVTLLPSGALLVHEAAAFVVSDVHVGYEDGARAAGSSLPTGPDPAAALVGAIAEGVSDLSVTKVLRGRDPRVIVNGDVKHAFGPLLAQAKAVRSFHERVAARLAIEYVLGNHDGGLASILPSARVFATTRAGRYAVAHGHEPVPAGPAILGHEHPIALLRDEAGNRIRARCFLRVRERWVLPAFSTWAAGVDVLSLRRFHGGALRGADPSAAEVFVLGEGEVLRFGTVADLRKGGFA